MWYRTGAVSVTAGSATVTGADTEWVQWIRVGDAFQGPDGRLYEIANVASDTAIAINPPYAGPTAAAQAYTILPVQGYTKRLADRAAELIGNYSDAEQMARGALQKAQNLNDLTSYADARANLDLGNSATRDVGTAAGTVAAGDDSRIAGAAQTSALGAAAYANIVGTMAAGDVFEQGSNANGEYVKFANGTMICTCRRNLDPGSIDSQLGVLFAGHKDSVNFAAMFIAPPNISLTVHSPTSHVADTYAMFAYVLASHSASSYFPVVVSPRMASVSDRVIFEQAIGRWKE